MTQANSNSDQGDILVVDDQPENIRFLSVMLADQGYAVRKSLSGQMALTAVRSLPPDLILLDVNMPDLDGYQVCQALQADPTTRDIPIIFLTAQGDTMDKVKAFQMGASDYVTKPFQFEEVLVRIRHQITIRQLQKQLKQQNTTLASTLEELKKAQAALVQREKMIGLGQLVAGVSHEINNPVSFISGNIGHVRQYAEDLIKLVQLYHQRYPEETPEIKQAIQEMDLEFVTSDLQDLLESMETGVNRIRSVVLALRIFSRLGESEIKEIDLHEALNSILVLLHHRLNPGGHYRIITVHRDYGEIPLLTCYASYFNQVLLNLLSNAIDALEVAQDQGLLVSEPPQIWITTSRTASDRVQISIRDNGIGISEALQQRLFDPFFTTKPPGQGLGLGLFNSYQVIVERHNGSLTCRSTPRVGSEFIVEVPLGRSGATVGQGQGLNPPVNPDPKSSDQDQAQ